jgi:hypothetical protein
VVCGDAFDTAIQEQFCRDRVRDANVEPDVRWAIRLSATTRVPVEQYPAGGFESLEIERREPHLAFRSSSEAIRMHHSRASSEGILNHVRTCVSRHVEQRSCGLRRHDNPIHSKS